MARRLDVDILLVADDALEVVNAWVLAEIDGSVGFGRRSLTIRACSTDGKLVGALQGKVRAGGAYVSVVAVAKQARSQGIARRLIQRFGSAAAAAEPVGVVYLAAFDFQGSGYYPKIGFRGDSSLPGWAHGITASFFSKAVSPDPELTSADVSVEELVVDSEEAAEADAFLSDVIAENEAELIGISDGFFAFAFEAKEAATEAGEVDKRVGAITGASFWGALVISALAVSPAHRRQGIGRKLVQRALDLAREEHLKLVVVDALTCEVPEFWKALGFVEFGRVTGFTEGTELIQMVMRLEPTDGVGHAAVPTALRSS